MQIFHTQLSSSMDKIFSHFWHIYIFKEKKMFSLSQSSGYAILKSTSQEVDFPTWSYF